MLTMKKLENKIKELENNIPQTIEYCKYIVRKELYKPKLDKEKEQYEKIKKELIKRGFKYIKTETLSWGYDQYEIWEKEYANGEF